MGFRLRGLGLIAKEVLITDLTKEVCIAGTTLEFSVYGFGFRGSGVWEFAG